MSALVKLASWFDDRTGWLGARVRLRSRSVASTPESYLVALGLSFFLFLVASGVLLMLHYRPNPGEAYASVVRIEGAVRFGALVRGVHLWSSDGLVAAVLGYTLWLLARRGYRRPDELVWLGALLTGVVVVALAISGALLSWSDQAAADASVIAGAAGELPVIGGWLRRLLLGGVDATGATLPRAFGFHVAVLPALLTLAIVVQAAFVARSSARREVARVPVYPDALLRFAIVLVGALLLVVTLATFVPRPPDVAQAPPWYLAFGHAFVRLTPTTLLGMSSVRVLVGLMSMGGVLLVALPFVDPRGSRIVAYLAAILLAALVGLTIYAMA